MLGRPESIWNPAGFCVDLSQGLCTHLNSLGGSVLSGGAFAAHAIDRGIAGKGMGVGVYDGEAGSGMVSLLQRDFCQRYVCAHRGGR